MSYCASIDGPETLAVFDIKGEIAAVTKRLSSLGIALPSEKNTAVTKDGLQLCWVGPHHWILLAEAQLEERLQRTLTPDDPSVDCRVVLVSDVHAIFRLIGPQADDVLAIASPLDTRHKNFPIHGATFGDLFGIRALIMRQGDGYITAIERSYADMISKYFSKILTGKI